MEIQNTETLSTFPSSSDMSIQPTPAPFSLHSPTTRTASKLSFLYELNYVPEEQKVYHEELPLINPYHAFVKLVNPLARTFKQLVKTTPRRVKEYIQSIKFSQCNLPTTT